MKSLRSAKRKVLRQLKKKFELLAELTRLSNEVDRLQGLNNALTKEVEYFRSKPKEEVSELRSRSEDHAVGEVTFHYNGIKITLVSE